MLPEGLQPVARPVKTEGSSQAWASAGANLLLCLAGRLQQLEQGRAVLRAADQAVQLA